MNEQRDWLKSSFSQSDRRCVQVRFIDDKAQVCDGRDSRGPILVFTRSEWEAFELGVFHGEFAFPVDE